MVTELWALVHLPVLIIFWSNVRLHVLGFMRSDC